MRDPEIPSHLLTDDTIDFAAYLRETDAGERVRPASAYAEAVKQSFRPSVATTYPRLPFRGTYLEFRPGEVTVWAGFNGSGKSLLQGQIITDFALAGEKTCIASFEMKPEKTLARMARQHAERIDPSDVDIDDLIERIAGRVWLYDQQGTVHAKRIIAVVKHCAEVLGCSQIAIDSLMKCIRGEDDYNGQKDFIDQITAAARDYNVHIHLVHHLKKGDGDDRLPTRMDLRGSASIADQVDNVLIVWRNKKKERERDAGKSVDAHDPDTVIVCDKQRNGDWEGRAKLWYWRNAMKFVDTVQA